jgi:hypothetical protein
MAELGDFIKAVVGVVVALSAVYYVTTQEYWFFAISALIGWTVADFVYEALEARASTDPIEFVIYSVMVIVASAAGAWVVQWIIPDVLSSVQNTGITHSIEFWPLMFYNAVAGAIAYVLPNLPVLAASFRRNDGMGWQYP